MRRESVLCFPEFLWGKHHIYLTLRDTIDKTAIPRIRVMTLKNVVVKSFQGPRGGNLAFGVIFSCHFNIKSELELLYLIAEMLQHINPRLLGYEIAVDTTRGVSSEARVFDLPNIACVAATCLKEIIGKFSDFDPVILPAECHQCLGFCK